MNEGLVTYEGRPSTITQIKAEIQLIQQILSEIMIKDVHYGTIPGTPKPTLYKPGSEKILRTFHIGVDPSENVQDLSTEDEIRYRVYTRAFDQTTGRLLGVGAGEASSSEEKYKWKKPVCDAEFEETTPDRKRMVWKKNYGKIEQIKQIRTNPADVANTILKMAKKRSQIDMTLTVTAASDVFEQDLEDLPDGVRENMTEDQKPPSKASTVKPSKPKDETPQDTRTVKEKLRDELTAYCGGDPEKMKATLKECSSFGNPPKWFDEVDKGSDKWCGTALGALRKLVESGKEPSSCTEDPDTCQWLTHQGDVEWCDREAKECDRV